MTDEAKFTLELSGLDPITNLFGLAIRACEIHNKYLELMTPEQRKAYIDRQMADNDIFLSLPRKIATRITKWLEENK
jgi:hypothetical protein